MTCAQWDSRESEQSSDRPAETAADESGSAGECEGEPDPAEGQEPDYLRWEQHLIQDRPAAGDVEERHDLQERGHEDGKQHRAGGADVAPESAPRNTRPDR